MRIKKAGATVFVGLLASAQVPSGAAVGHSILQLPPDVSEVARTVVVLTPPGLMTRTPMTEQQLVEGGCRFSSVDAAKQAGLAELVRRNVKNQQGDARAFFLRNAVYFHLKNGTTVRYLFSGADDAGHIYGAADAGGMQTTPFTADGGLLGDLGNWSADARVEKNGGQWCAGNK